ncbi:MAG: hypothetical protein Q8R27_01095 [Phenylobacterium sp.]|nr:hypothetical protein [Phenylobacterium sp.]
MFELGYHINPQGGAIGQTIGWRGGDPGSSRPAGSWDTQSPAGILNRLDGDLALANKRLLDLTSMKNASAPYAAGHAI